MKIRKPFFWSLVWFFCLLLELTTHTFATTALRPPPPNISETKNLEVKKQPKNKQDSLPLKAEKNKRKAPNTTPEEEPPKKKGLSSNKVGNAIGIASIAASIGIFAGEAAGLTNHPVTVENVEDFKSIANQAPTD